MIYSNEQKNNLRIKIDYNNMMKKYIGEYGILPLPHFHPHGADQLPVLIRGDEQGGGEAGEALLGGISGRLLHAAGIAVATAVVRIGCHGGGEGPQAVEVTLPQVQADVLGILPQRVSPGLVFQEWVNVGIIPETYWLHPLLPELLDAGYGAGSATNVEQEIRHGRTFFPITGNDKLGMMLSFGLALPYGPMFHWAAGSAGTQLCVHRAFHLLWPPALGLPYSSKFRLSARSVRTMDTTIRRSWTPMGTQDHMPTASAFRPRRGSMASVDRGSDAAPNHFHSRPQ